LASWALPDPKICGRCHERPAMLPETLAEGRPSGTMCRDCLVHMFALCATAMENYFGPIGPGLPTNQLLDMELLWAEAALQEPRTIDMAEIRRRYNELMTRKYEVSAERMKVDEDALKRWLEPPREG
jgi:hypothetical protein